MKINLPKYENSSVERFVNAVVKLWNSINKWVLFGSLASLTLIATLCFPAMFLKILLIFEVIGLSTALLVTTSSNDKVDEENIDDGTSSASTHDEYDEFVKHYNDTPKNTNMYGGDANNKRPNKIQIIPMFPYLLRY